MAVAGVARHSHRGIGAHPAGAHAVRAGGLPAAGVHHRHAVGTGAVRGTDRACDAAGPGPDARRLEAVARHGRAVLLLAACVAAVALASKLASDVPWNEVDRKSTRLNSSH